MIATIATIAIAGVLNAVRFATVVGTAHAVMAYVRIQDHFEQLLYRRHDDDPRY